MLSKLHNIVISSILRKTTYSESSIPTLILRVRSFVTIVIVTFVAGLITSPVNAQSGQWVWMGGSNSSNQHGVYGTQGIPSAANIPGGRYGSATWTDNQGNFWLFGGVGDDANGAFGVMNDLWKFNPSTQQWTWMSGAKAVGSSFLVPGVYGTLGVPASTNIPGGRAAQGGTWTDSSGNLWLFGGQGAYTSSTNTFYLNDIWQFNPSTGLWTWWGGGTSTVQKGTLGVPAPGNIPDPRAGTVSWSDSSGNFWLGEGQVVYYLNDTCPACEGDDLWQFNPSTKEWAWMGPNTPTNQSTGSYGVLGVPAPGNYPSSRAYAAVSIGSDGSPWIFGGGGLDSNLNIGFLNDLWEFNAASQEWTWVDGYNWVGGWSVILGYEDEYYGINSSFGPLGVPSALSIPGGRERANSWTDGNGNHWLFGGQAFDYTGRFGTINEFWEFNPSIGEWTWMGGSKQIGSNGYPAGVYGTLGTPAAANIPSGRGHGSSWTDSQGNFWLFGGYANDASNNNHFFNDLWEYRITSAPQQQAPAPTFSVASGAYGVPQFLSIKDSILGATIYYTIDGSTPTTSSTIFNGVPIEISSSQTVQAFALAGGYSASPVASAVYALTVSQPALLPAFSLASGTYTSQQTVTISDKTPGAVIHYTVDGSLPTATSPIYTAPVIIGSTETIQAIAVAAGYFNSAVRQAQYVIATPIPSPGAGMIATVAGNGGWQCCDDGVMAINSPLNAPYAVAVDMYGNLFIADYQNNRVRMVIAGTDVISTVAGNGSCCGYNGDGIAATSARLSGPTGIAVDSSGNLYIAEYNGHRIRKVSLSTGLISTVAGNGTAGFIDNTQATSAELNYPIGVAVDASGNLYIADTSNSRIRKVTASSGLISTVAGSSASGFNGDGIPAVAAQLNYPYGAAVDASGNLYIADTGNDRIREVSVATGLISTLAGGGNSTYGSGILALSASLEGPTGVATDASGNVYLADNGDAFIRQIQAGNIYNLAGAGFMNYTFNNIPAVNALASSPFGIAVGPSGNIYFADNVDNVVRVIGASQTVTSQKPIPTRPHAPLAPVEPIVSRHPIFHSVSAKSN